MAKLMDKLRNDPPAELAGFKVTERRDYLKDTVLDVATGKVSSTGLPTSNVLYFRTEADDVIVIRPSGTEPKIKTYILCHGSSRENVREKVAAYSKVTETWTE